MRFQRRLCSLQCIMCGQCCLGFQPIGDDAAVKSHLLLTQWQAQPLGAAKGRPPTVGAKSLPNFLIGHSGAQGAGAAKAKVLSQLPSR